MQPLLRKQITVAGVRLRYLEREPLHPFAQPPLLLLHQLLASDETLIELIGQLPTDRRIVAVDLLSAEPLKGTLDLRSHHLAGLIAEFIAAISLDRPIVFGHSYGGTLALWLAATPAVQVQGLVLLSPAHPFAGYRAHVVAFYLTRWGRFLALRIPLAPARMILWAYNEAAGPGRPITLAHLKPHLQVVRVRRSLKRVLQILATWETDMDDLRATLMAHPLTPPALLIWGEHDIIVPPESADALQAALLASERTVLTGKGHLLPEEATSECGALICAWLNR